MLNNEHDAEDAVQIVFEKLVANPRKFCDENHERAWLITTARNHCRDVLKSAYRRKTSLNDEMSTVEKPTMQDKTDLRDFIAMLSPKYRLCIYLYYFEGYKATEIAKLMGKPPSTIRNYLHEARVLLKSFLFDERGDDCA